jgi:cation diffusion facilitator family transporter
VTREGGPPRVDRRVERVVLEILVLNLAVAAAKGVYGYLSGSLAVASDALHSGLDAASNIVGFVALRLAARPPDEDHPYGHDKVEIVAAALIGLVIAGGAVNFGIEAAKALVVGRPPPEVGSGGFVVMLGTLVVNLFVAWYERRRGRALESPFLVADAAHTGSDVIVTIGVIAALAGSRLGLTWADPVASLAVLGVVAFVGVRIIRANVDVLIDRAALDAEELAKVALEVPGVLGCHRVRSRGIGGLLRVDLHVVLDGQMTLEEAHEITHEVETRIQARFPNAQDVVIHTEPSSAPED